MPENLQLFYDDVLAALRGLVSYCGGSKAIGEQIWPAKKDKAGSWLDDCLNPDRAAKLDPAEFLMMLAIARKKSFHGVMQFVGDETGYDVKPREPRDELQELLRENLEAERLSQQRAARIEALLSGLNVDQRSALRIAK